MGVGDTDVFDSRLRCLERLQREEMARAQGGPNAMTRSFDVGCFIGDVLHGNMAFTLVRLEVDPCVNISTFGAIQIFGCSLASHPTKVLGTSPNIQKSTIFLSADPLDTETAFEEPEQALRAARAEFGAGEQAGRGVL